MKKQKRKNPQDTTLRNNQARKKEIAELRKRVKELEKDMKLAKETCCMLYHLVQSDEHVRHRISLKVNKAAAKLKLEGRK